MSLTPADLLAHLEAWILGRLEHLEHRGYSDASGHPHGGAVVCISEWELRAKRDEIRTVLDSLKTASGLAEERSKALKDLTNIAHQGALGALSALEKTARAARAAKKGRKK